MNQLENMNVFSEPYRATQAQTEAKTTVNNQFTYKYVLFFWKKENERTEKVKLCRGKWKSAS